jgi:hypothetical protein
MDPAEPKTEVQAEQFQWVFEGPQASSCEDGNIVGSRQAPVHHTQSLTFIFN